MVGNIFCIQCGEIRGWHHIDGNGIVSHVWSHMPQYLQALTLWSQNNDMMINRAKTNDLVIGRLGTAKQQLTVYTQDGMIQKRQSVSYLNVQGTFRIGLLHITQAYHCYTTVDQTKHATSFGPSCSQTCAFMRCFCPRVIVTFFPYWETHEPIPVISNITKKYQSFINYGLLHYQ